MALKDIIVPAMGESVSEATISKWFKKAGDSVKMDEAVAEIETDKVTLEVNSPASGVLKEIIAKEGSTVQVGALIGRVEEGAVATGVSSQVSDVKQQPVPEKQPEKQAETRILRPEALPEKSGPAARKIADEAGINLANVQGTGKDGRATKGDVLAYAAAPQPQRTSAPAGREERVKMTKLRQTIAKRLKDSQNTAAILTTFNEIDMSNVIALRNEYKEAFEKKYGARLGFMSFFVKAAVAALKEVPEVNASIEGDEIVYKRYYDIGVAVGGAQGLVVPVVRNADELSIAEIEAEIARLAQKAKDGTLAMSDMAGGTFTVSNGGVYGSLLSTPIINPPQSAILGMHKTEERPIAVKGQVIIHPMMYVALSYDHRIIDGRESVTFLVKIKEAVEDPRRLLLGV